MHWPTCGSVWGSLARRVRASFGGTRRQDTPGFAAGQFAGRPSPSFRQFSRAALAS